MVRHGKGGHRSGSIGHGSGKGHASGGHSSGGHHASGGGHSSGGASGHSRGASHSRAAPVTHTSSGGKAGDAQAQAAAAYAAGKRKAGENFLVTKVLPTGQRVSAYGKTQAEASSRAQSLYTQSVRSSRQTRAILKEESGLKLTPSERASYRKTTAAQRANTLQEFRTDRERRKAIGALADKTKPKTVTISYEQERDPETGMLKPLTEEQRKTGKITQVSEALYGAGLLGKTLNIKQVKEVTSGRVDIDALREAQQLTEAEQKSRFGFVAVEQPKPEPKPEVTPEITPGGVTLIADLPKEEREAYESIIADDPTFAERYAALVSKPMVDLVSAQEDVTAKPGVKPGVSILPMPHGFVPPKGVTLIKDLPEEERKAFEEIMEKPEEPDKVFGIIPRKRSAEEALEMAEEGAKTRYAELTDIYKRIHDDVEDNVTTGESLRWVFTTTQHERKAIREGATYQEYYDEYEHPVTKKLGFGEEATGLPFLPSGRELIEKPGTFALKVVELPAWYLGLKGVGVAVKGVSKGVQTLPWMKTLAATGKAGTFVTKTTGTVAGVATTFGALEVGAEVIEPLTISKEQRELVKTEGETIQEVRDILKEEKSQYIAGMGFFKGIVPSALPFTVSPKGQEKAEEYLKEKGITDTQQYIETAARLEAVQERKFTAKLATAEIGANILGGGLISVFKPKGLGPFFTAGALEGFFSWEAISERHPKIIWQPTVPFTEIPIGPEWQIERKAYFAKMPSGEAKEALVKGQESYLKEKADYDKLVADFEANYEKDETGAYLVPEGMQEKMEKEFGEYKTSREEYDKLVEEHSEESRFRVGYFGGAAITTALASATAAGFMKFIGYPIQTRVAGVRGERLATGVGWAFDFPMEPIGDIPLMTRTAVVTPGGPTATFGVTGEAPMEAPVDLKTIQPEQQFQVDIETKPEPVKIKEVKKPKVKPKPKAPVKAFELAPQDTMMTQIGTAVETEQVMMMPEPVDVPVKAPVEADVPSDVLVDVPIDVQAVTDVPVKVETEVQVDVPAVTEVETEVPIDVMIQTDVPVDVPATVPTARGFIPWFPTPGGPGRFRFPGAARPVEKRAFKYVPDVMAMVMGETAPTRPMPQFGVFTGQERRFIIRPEPTRNGVGIPKAATMAMPTAATIFKKKKKKKVKKIRKVKRRKKR